MNRGPSFVLNTLPVCGSPCSSCSGAPWSVTARPRSRSVLLRSSRSAASSAGMRSTLPFGSATRSVKCGVRPPRWSAAQLTSIDRMPACSRASALA